MTLRNFLPIAFSALVTLGLAMTLAERVFPAVAAAQLGECGGC